MSDHSNILPDPPLDYQPDRSCHFNCTTIDGTHHTAAWDRLHNKGQLWAQFKSMQEDPELKAWQRRVYVAGHYSPGKGLVEHGEKILYDIENGKV